MGLLTSKMAEVCSLKDVRPFTEMKSESSASRGLLLCNGNSNFGESLWFALIFNELYFGLSARSPPFFCESSLSLNILCQRCSQRSLNERVKSN